MKGPRIMPVGIPKVIDSNNAAVNRTLATCNFFKNI